MTDHQQLPQDKGLDHTLELLKEGYYFIMNRSNKFDSRIFETRLLGEKAICLVGEQEAKLFYDNEKFQRKKAAPSRIQKTLFGKGGVQGLDDQEHRHRKAMFMTLMTDDKLEEIRRLTREEWRNQISDEKHEVNVYEAAKQVLTRMALRWTGIPFKKEEAEQWGEEFSDMFEHAADIGPKHWKARWSRQRAEGWLEDLVQQVRKEKVEVDQDRALYQFSLHKDPKGKLLKPYIVAVELLNLLRPIVATAVYIDFAVLAMHDYPTEVAQIRGDNGRQFIQEVRRFYPFFPFTAARVKQDFIWNDYEFKKGTLTLLDLYGTNHDPVIWDQPNQFKPERFNDWKSNPFDFIPQGGGEFDIGHRCAGEWITIDILNETVNFFSKEISFDFPDQDFGYSMNDIPTLPQSNIIITNIQTTH
ncbi:fatty-acid peroxygenase [Gracilibacillus orientalis]|uniref:Fatty-acid peroxygenase n=1 Tax=Gracilibacillus orientalis TaxID=334253 RepID=A0A1I4IUP6_9BACI|nr:cytochrome P450 [Gracilibacillus orientalis]SFL57571.1 fatty-acid peroxygenase [Gracilibacillus orientalis]